MLCIISGCNRSGDSSRTLNLFGWSEYVPQEVIDGFTRETGIHVNYEAYDSNEAMLTKLSQAPHRYDLIQPSEYVVEALIHRQMLEPLELSQIPNFKNIDPKYRDLPYDPGNRFSVPYIAGTVGIVVNTDAIKDPIRGYADVFQKKYDHRIVVVDDNREIVAWVFDELKIPVNDVSPANLRKARPLLQQWLPLVKVFNSINPADPLLRGECDLGIVYSGDAAKAYQEGLKLPTPKHFQYILPAEGVHEWVDNLCIPKGAPHKQAAEKFINYILRPEVSKLISDKFPYTNPNAEARKLLSPERLDNPASYPKQLGRTEVFHDIGAEADDLSQMMTELRSELK